MEITSSKVLKTYVTLTLLSTLASSFIWGINTLFLLDAGLNITQAFAANAFFTLGQVVFEVPTGVVADTLGRRISYLLGAATLFVSTFLYLLLWEIKGPFWAWALVSVMLGLGFTFFSGATEAWLVDGLKHTKYKSSLESAFAKGQIASGVAMLVGTVGGGVIAQVTNLGVPYILRIVMLGLTFIVAFLLMRDVGFTPKKVTSMTLIKRMKSVFVTSLAHGFHKPAIRWVMLAGPFVYGVSFYGFYAMQPYLLELYGNKESYAIAGLAAAIIASAQIVGGFIAPGLHKISKRRTTILAMGVVLSSAALILIGLVSNFWIVLALLIVWALVFAASFPVRQAYLNGLIPSEERATILSSDNLLGSTGGVVFQPALGKVADVTGYAASYVVSGGIWLLALPFLLLARAEHASSDPIKNGATDTPKT